MKLTLLELVQDMLIACESENTSSVNETEESARMVNIANECYETMISKKRWKHMKKLAIMEAASDLNTLSLPEEATYFDEKNIFYTGVRVTYLEPKVFLSLTEPRLETDSNITVISQIKTYNDRIPLFCTSFDTRTLVFDSCVDTINGLQPSNCKILIYEAPTSRLNGDGDIFHLPHQAFPALQKYCIGTAINRVKSDSNGAAIELKEYHSLMAALSRNNSLIEGEQDMRDNIVSRPARGHYPFQYQPLINNN